MPVGWLKEREHDNLAKIFRAVSSRYLTLRSLKPIVSKIATVKSPLHLVSCTCCGKLNETSERVLRIY